MTRRAACLAAALCALAPAGAHAFCGFYVGKAGAELYNHASQVVLARDGQRTVLTMSNDFQGNAKDFALVVPVPSVLKKEQVHIGERKLVQRIDSYSAPRLVEYFDPNPCKLIYERKTTVNFEDDTIEGDLTRPDGEYLEARKHVKVEAEYSVGEYDIVILSSDESNALESWLKAKGYQLPPRAAQALEPYIKQNMKFFVARVNLKEQQKAGFEYLRPIQIAYESEKFMLPIRLGMANSKGEQDLLVYTITRKGRVESTNYKTEPVPTGQTVPLFVKDAFKEVYPAIFEVAHRKSNYRAVHTEYVWRASGCDPCVDEPLTPGELKGLGAFWVENYASEQPVVTRLHVRYDREHFPEDLLFQETGDGANFQARYVLQHPAEGDLSCEAGKKYLESLDGRRQDEVRALVDLTGWPPADIVKRIGTEAPKGASEPWYKRIWK